MQEEMAFTVQGVIERKAHCYMSVESPATSSIKLLLYQYQHTFKDLCVCNVHGLWISPWQHLASGMAHLVTMSRLDDLLSKITVRREKRAN